MATTTFTVASDNVIVPDHILDFHNVFAGGVFARVNNTRLVANRGGPADVKTHYGNMTNKWPRFSLLRFNVTIPNGATINSATLQLQGNKGTNGGNTVGIRGHDAQTPPLVGTWDFSDVVTGTYNTTQPDNGFNWANLKARENHVITAGIGTKNIDVTDTVTALVGSYNYSAGKPMLLYFSGMPSWNSGAGQYAPSYTYMVGYTFSGGAHSAHTFDSLESANDPKLIINYTAGGIPNAPSGLNVTPVAWNQMDLTWVDNATDEVSFTVERSLTNGAPWTVLTTSLTANTISYSDTTTPLGNTIYYYRVKAVNVTGSSTHATASGTAPAAPTQISFTTRPEDTLKFQESIITVSGNQLLGFDGSSDPELKPYGDFVQTTNSITPTLSTATGLYLTINVSGSSFGIPLYQ